MKSKSIIFLKTLSVMLIVIAGGCSSMKNTINDMYQDIGKINPEKITEDDIKQVPEIVQNYLRFTNIIGKQRIKSVRLKQTGDFRLKPEQGFKKMRAVQYFNVDSVEFYWKGKVNIITAVDKFINGKGSLTVKLLGLIRVARAEGPEADQGEILRFLAEGVWFPSVFINDYITWELLDDHSAKATIRVNGISASAVFHFNDKYEVEKITAKRYMESDGKFKLEDWEIQIIGYKEFSGIMIPDRANVIWKLSSGDFCWYKLEISEIEYNNPSIYKGSK